MKEALLIIFVLVMALSSGLLIAVHQGRQQAAQLSCMASGGHWLNGHCAPDTRVRT